MRLFSPAASAVADCVRIALNLKSIPYELVLVDSSRGGEAIMPKRLKATGPAPVLLDQRRMFTEPLAIIEYLDESYPQPSLLPGSPRDRAQIRTISEIVISNLHSMVSLRMQGYVASAAGVALDARYECWIADGLTLVEDVISSNAARGRFSHGDDPSMADVCLVPHIWTARRLGLDLLPYPTINRVYGRCMTLAAFNRVASDSP